MKFFLIIALLAITSSFSWKSTSAQVNFTSIKDETIPVQGTIATKINLYKGKFTAIADLNSLSTNLEPRDLNIKKVFFQSAKYPNIKITGSLDEKLFPQKVGEKTVHTIPFSISFMGKTIEKKISLGFIKAKDNLIQVYTTTPSNVSIVDLQLSKGLENLIKVCGHKSVSNLVFISLDAELTN